MTEVKGLKEKEREKVTCRRGGKEEHEHALFLYI